MENKEKIYDALIAPLMTTIINICQEHEIPFAAQFIYGKDDNDDEMSCSSCMSFDSKQIKKVYRTIMGESSLPGFAMTIIRGNRQC